jgi:hypothetical protein
VKKRRAGGEEGERKAGVEGSFFVSLNLIIYLSLSISLPPFFCLQTFPITHTCSTCIMSSYFRVELLFSL